jgi:hypothetical protein
MKRLFYLLVLLAALAAGCSGSSSGDAGQGDAGDGADVDPCTAARSEWQRVWTVNQVSTGLEGRTPEINVMDVWGSAPDDIYAVGFAGNILHYDGSSWQKMESGTTENLEGVWGFVLKDDQGKVTRREVFAVGQNGIILRYDGTAWQPQRVINDPDPAHPDPQPVSGNFHDVWGIPAPGPQPTQHPVVIAVGGEGLIVRWDGVRGEFLEMRRREEFQYPCDGGTCTRISYQRYSPERLGGVFGTSADFFVAVGNNGTILEYDGSRWNRRVILDFNTHLNGVWGRGSFEIFAVGLEGTILRRNSGGNWEFLKDLAQAAGGYLELEPVYLRGLWAFYQSKCGPVPDGGTEPQDTSWAIFAGWDNHLYMFHDRLICPFGKLPVDRWESIWGQPPRSEADRTLPDGGIVCDPVEAWISGVNGLVVRLVNPKGQ